MAYSVIDDLFEVFRWLLDKINFCDPIVEVVLLVLACYFSLKIYQWLRYSRKAIRESIKAIKEDLKGVEGEELEEKVKEELKEDLNQLWKCIFLLLLFVGGVAFSPFLILIQSVRFCSYAFAFIVHPVIIFFLACFFSGFGVSIFMEFIFGRAYVIECISKELNLSLSKAENIFHETFYPKWAYLPFLVFIFMFSILIFSLLFLAMNHYKLVKDDGIYENPFFSLETRKICSWSDIKEIRHIIWGFEKIKGEYFLDTDEIEERWEIVLKDNKTIDLLNVNYKEIHGKNEKELIRFLADKTSEFRDYFEVKDSHRLIPTINCVTVRETPLGGKYYRCSI